MPNVIKFTDLSIIDTDLLYTITNPSSAELAEWTKTVLSIESYDVYYSLLKSLKDKYGGSVHIVTITKPFMKNSSSRHSGASHKKHLPDTYCKIIVFFRKSSDALTFKLKYNASDYAGDSFI